MPKTEESWTWIDRWHYLFNGRIPDEPAAEDPNYVKHQVVGNGYRWHVLSWRRNHDGTVRERCSEPNCITNKRAREGKDDA